MVINVPVDWGVNAVEQRAGEVTSRLHPQIFRLRAASPLEWSGSHVTRGLRENTRTRRCEYFEYPKKAQLRRMDPRFGRQNRGSNTSSGNVNSGTSSRRGVGWSRVAEASRVMKL